MWLNNNNNNTILPDGICTNLENEMYKILWSFEIQTDHQIPAKRPPLVIVNKTKSICRIVDFTIPANHSENQRNWNT